jgi:hypothetical protein
MYAIGLAPVQAHGATIAVRRRGLPLLEAAQHILQAETPLLGAIDPHLAGSIEHITARAMSRDRDRRYQSADELAGDLRAYLEGRHTAAFSTDTPSGHPLSIHRVRLRDDGWLVVTWDDGREQVFRPAE